MSEEQIIADVDVLVERPDLGDGAHTLVLAGDVIPSAWADYARHPVEQDGSSPRPRKAAK